MIAALKPYPGYKESGVSWLPEIPDHWDIRPNRAVFSEIKDRNFPNEEMLSVTIKKGVIRQSSFLEETVKKDSSNLDRSRYKLVQPGDIAYNKMRAWQGAFGVSDYRGIISPAYVVQRPRDNVDSRFFHYLFRTPIFSKESERWSYGITSDMWSLRPEHFKLIYTCIPPLPEQSTIVRFLDYVDSRIRRYIRAKQKLIKLLEEQKQGIIQQAVTGKIDVRTGKPYPDYQDSGVEWVRILPKHWEIRKLGTLGEFYKGRGISRADIRESGLPAITYGDIYTQYGVEVKKLNKYTSPEIAANALKIVQGDLLFTASGETVEDIGKTTLYSSITPGYAGGDIIVLRLNQGEGLYISFVLNSKVGVEQKSSFGRGDIIVHIPSSKLKQITVPFPPIPKQLVIAEYLTKISNDIDKSIRRNQQNIDLIREYRTRLISDVVTGKLDVREAAKGLPDEIEEESVEAQTESEMSLEETDIISEPEEVEV